MVGEVLLEGLAVIWAPVRTLERVAGEQRVLLGFTITALSAVLGLIVAVVNALGGVTASQFTSQNFPDLPPAFYENTPEIVSVMLLISAVLSPFVWWLVVSLLMQLVTRFFGGTGPLSAMLAVVGVANVPFVVFDELQETATVLKAMIGPESA